MSKNNIDDSKNWFQNIGLILAGLFYLVACVIVFVNNSGGKLLAPSQKTITFAHWNLEDGFREGYAEAIQRFEDYKAKQGQKVKVIQTTVPFRGYPQWFLTQLIGGTPADVIKLSGSSEQHNQYFVPLSAYIGKPNPFNRGTPFESVPWKDTFLDNMNGGLNADYGEYYGIGINSATYRVYVNLDLLEKATGSRKMPDTLTEWLTVCEKLKEYGEKIGKPIIPIGVRGFDKRTLNYLFYYYFSQMNSDLNEDMSGNCSPRAENAKIFEALAGNRLSREKILAAADIIKQIGQYFCKGFTATDQEQTKFLFFAGNVGFFPEGTWNAYSMVKNSPFEVGIAEIPVIGDDHEYSKYFVGRPTEQGLGVGGLFGIPKASKNFSMALEFLQFTTSWKINQMIMADYCKWLPAVKKAEYKGILKYCQPQLGSGQRMICPPFYASIGTWRKMLESLETIIINNENEAGKIFWRDFIERIPLEIEEIEDTITATRRTMLSIEKQRSAIAVAGLVTDLQAEAEKRLENRYELILESLISSYRNMACYRETITILRKLRKKEGK
ncbi:MAG: extracellular solute-binding protein [Victivallales bacterium]